MRKYLISKTNSCHTNCVYSYCYTDCVCWYYSIYLQNKSCSQWCGGFYFPDMSFYKIPSLMSGLKSQFIWLSFCFSKENVQNEYKVNFNRLDYYGRINLRFLSKTIIVGCNSVAKNSHIFILHFGNTLVLGWWVFCFLSKVIIGLI